jgi:hypothetical protein
LFHLPINYSHPTYYHYYLIQSVMFDHIRKVKDFTVYFLFCSFFEHSFFPHILVSDFLFKEFPLKFLAKKFLWVTNSFKFYLPKKVFVCPQNL